MARVFDGSTGYVSLGTPSSLNIGGHSNTADSFSISCWIRPDTVGSNNDIVSHSASSWLLRQNGGAAGLFVIRDESGGGSEAVGRTKLTPGALWHIVGTFFNNSAVGNSEPITIFVNGVFDGSADPGNALFTLRTSAGPTLIGARPPVAPSNFFQGAIQDVAIWNGVALSQASVLALYRGVPPPQVGAITTYGSFIGPVCYLPLGLGSPEPDLSCHGVTGAITGTTKLFPSPGQPPKLILPRFHTTTPTPYVPRIATF